MARCEVMIGKLVSHPCAQRTAAACSQCAKPMCERHDSGTSPGTCVTCTGEHKVPAAPVTLTMHDLYEFSDDELSAFDAARRPSLHSYDS